MHVFARDGYSRATTNAIAAVAGISPGSLYPFFANKEQIAERLEHRYVERIRQARDAAASPRPEATLDERVAALVDAVVAYNLEMPGFHALFAERPTSPHLAQATHELHQAIVGEIDAMLVDRMPGLSTENRRMMTFVAVQVCRAMTPSIVGAMGKERERMAGELKLVLTSYLTSARRAES